MNRLTERFAQLKDEGRAGLVTYVTAGDPDLAGSRAILLALAEAGADVLEVGVPFSDPIADGPVIQRAVERALASGTTLDDVLRLVGEVRTSTSVPIVLFTYVNPVVRMGVTTFVDRAADAGVDGVLLLDLPIEEAGQMREALERRDIATIFLISPTTTPERIRKAAEWGRGFLYAISRLGVTGAQATVAGTARPVVDRIRRETSMPVALGFGVSRAEHVKEIGAYADAVVVGSALVQAIADAPNGEEASVAAAFIRQLRGGDGAA
ncbi:MAG: tryptophan synthase alpha chain [Acidimicrobiia bacterium]